MFDHCGLCSSLLCAVNVASLSPTLATFITQSNGGRSGVHLEMPMQISTSSSGWDSKPPVVLQLLDSMDKADAWSLVSSEAMKLRYNHVAGVHPSCHLQPTPVPACCPDCPLHCTPRSAYMARDCSAPAGPSQGCDATLVATHMPGSPPPQALYLPAGKARPAWPAIHVLQRNAIISTAATGSSTSPNLSLRRVLSQ